MSSGNINNKNIFSSLDSITKSLDSMSDRLGKIEKTCLDSKDSRADNTAGYFHLLPGIIERITTARDFDGVINELLETLSLTMDRGLILSLKEGKYIPLRSKGYDQMPEENPTPKDEPDDLLLSAVKSRQILIVKGNTGDQVSLDSDEDTRIRYCMFIPIVFGDQVPLVFYGESAKSPDPDLAESVISIAALVIKNQNLAAMLRMGPLERSSDNTENPDVKSGYEELSSLPGPGPEPEAAIPGDLKKIFHSVDDFDTDVISAEELIRSFNIDINRKIPDLEQETENFLDITETAEQEAEDIEEAGEEEQETWTESADFEIEMPVEESLVSELDSEEEAPEEEEEEVLAEAKEAVTPAESEPQPEGPITEKDVNEAAEEFEEALSFARLLVSEIKLYNEDSVEEGRKNGDLYSRLKEQIDLSREVYEARIADEVRTEKDYFGEELVRILANGNTKLLDT